MRPTRRQAFVVAVVAVLASAGGAVAGVSRVTLASDMARGTARRCGACHTPQYALWIKHPHSHFLIDPQRDPGYVGARWGRRVDGWEEHVAGRFERSDVALAYGVIGEQVYFREDPDGRRLLPAQWNLEERRWEPLPPDLQAVIEAGITWEQGCAGCHTTGYRSLDGTYEDPSTGCTACHGDGSAHVDTGGQAAILRPSSLPVARRSMVCGRCHSRGRDRTTGRPYVDRFAPGDDLLAVFGLVEPTPGVDTDHFWADGTERLPFMEYQGFLQSRHSKAGLSCPTCHLPHGSDYPHSLRRKTSELCRGCHDPARTTVPTHLGHPGGADCVDCHMSVVNPDARALQVRTHTFRFLNPATTVGTGRPSSCVGQCHSDRTPGWAVEAMERWKGTP